MRREVLPRRSPRVLFFAAQCTLLAWQRTGIALVGLGFVVERFGLFVSFGGGWSLTAGRATDRLGGARVDGERLNIDGVDVTVFNATRTIVDCFRFRNKIGLDVALEALRYGWRQRKSAPIDNSQAGNP